MTFTSAHLTAVGIALLVVIAATLLMQERRMPQSTLAWLLAIMVLPYVAAPLFLLLGARKFVRRRPHVLRKDAVATVDAPGTFRALGSARVRPGNRVALLDSPEAAWRALQRLVEEAESSLDAAYYIVSNDAEGRAFLRLLAGRAGQGVRVRLTLDRLGSFFPPRAELRLLRGAGAEMRWHAPLINRWSRGGLNLRNHRKVLIADGRRLMTGGMNVGADYMRSGRLQGGRLQGQDGARRPPFDDLNLWLEGPAVLDYRRLFETDWHAAGRNRLWHRLIEGGPPPKLPGPGRLPPVGAARVQLVASGPDRPLDALHKGLVAAIHRADRRVWLATPYFLPTSELVLALAVAGRRGVDVRLLLPARSNHAVADLASGSALRFLQGEGCRILRAGAMVHAKSGLVDDMGWVGTANLDLRSLLLNFETSLMLYDPATLGALEAWFRHRFGQAAEGVPKVGLPRRIGEGVFRLGAPLL